MRVCLSLVSHSCLLGGFFIGKTFFPISCVVGHSFFVITSIFLTLQQKGTFETGQEDSTEIPEELKLRLAYREAAVAVLACYFPDPFRPFIEVNGTIYSVPFLLV